MEATALSLAKLTLDTLLPLAKNALGDEAVLLLGVHEEVSFITNELEMMQAFLRAAGADHRASNEVAKIWVKQVRDLAYDVEDCLQEYLALDLGGGSLVGCCDDLPPPCARWLRSPGRLRTQHQIAVRIKQVKGRVEEISKRNLRYSIVVQPTSPAPVHDITIEHQLVDAEKFAAGIATEESELVGRDQHRAELVDRLVSLPSGEPLQVFALWGSGGVGKTVLARDVLRSPRLRQAFQLRPWVTVAHPCVTAEFISSLASQLLELMEEESRSAQSTQHTRVLRHLRDRKYAMVVDDVLTIAEWENIRRALPDGSTGSCVVVTTRDEGVAMHCSSSSRHVRKLDCLSHTESLQLLCKKVQLEEAGPLMPMVDPILKRCCGLPLAVAAVGKLLATMKTPAEWKKLHDHLGSELKSNPRLEEITNVLTSSYEGLPYHLKSCFLYLSIFPKYRELRQTRVSWRWMAEGLVPETCTSSGGGGSMDPEDVGENYFNQLISRSMIQPATTWVNLNDRINTAQVHDMMREIIRTKAAEENQLFNLDARLPSRLPREKIRHLVLTNDDCRWPAGSDVLEGISNMWQVRSLTVNGECPPRLIVPSRMKMLRVLDLEDSINATDEHLAGIGELRQLKYLGLKKTGITKLPESVGRLKFLQSLDIRGTKVTTIPQGITKLERLRHLMAGNGMLHDDDNTFSSLPSRPRFSSWRAMSSSILTTTTTTTTTIGQHSGVRLPDGFGRLKSMHNLGTVDVGKDGQRIFKDISKLAGLWSLEITELTDRNGREFRNMIRELVSLRDLEVRSRPGNRSGLFHCLDMKESPPLHLITLRLCGHLGRLPSWIGHLQYITKIKLLATELEQDAIEMLGDLPNLTGLHLWRMSYVGRELRLGTRKFAKLKLIDINRLEDLVSLVIEGASTPQLEWLWLKQCSRLSDDEKGVVGVPLLRRLRELQIVLCGEKPKLVDQLQKQLGDHQNRPLFECF